MFAAKGEGEVSREVFTHVFYVNICRKLRNPIGYFYCFRLLYYHIPRKGVSISFSQSIHSYFNNGLTFDIYLRIIWYNK